MQTWFESSLNDLYQSAVAAFPYTTKRQYAIDPIVITNLNWVPFLGMKTLFIKGLAQSEGKEYGPTIVFKKVTYHDQQGVGKVSFTASNGQDYIIEQLDISDQDVLLRCNCGDYRWRWVHFNHLDKSNQGRDRKKYEALYNPGSANPTESIGMCKHLMKMSLALKESGILA